MKSTLIASVAALGVVDIAAVEGIARLAVYLAPVVVGIVQSFQKRKGRARTAKARATVLTRRIAPGPVTKLP